MDLMEKLPSPFMPKIDRRVFVLGIILFIFVTTFFIANKSQHVSQYIGKVHDIPSEKPSNVQELHPESVKQLQNATLGFEKVYVINLPARGDKLDAMTLSASLTGFGFDVINGVDGKNTPDKALPGPFKPGPNRNKMVGSWRAHLNLAKQIVSHRISTALIFEDDADWDIDFRRQLIDFALASNLLLNTPSSSGKQQQQPHSPYGDKWDLLWLGHCGSSPDDSDPRRFIVKNDPTVPPMSHRFEIGHVADTMKPDKPGQSPHQKWDNHTRIHFSQTRGLCTYSFALSFRGAQKLLYYLSMKLWHGAFDLGLEDMCKYKDREFKCISVYPQIVDSHRGAGNVKGDSDLSDSGAEGVRPDDKIFTYNIVTSTRMNVDALMNGKKNRGEMKSQWKVEDGVLMKGKRLVREWLPQG